MISDIANENIITSQCLTPTTQFFRYKILYRLSAALGITYIASSARRLSCSTMMAAPEHDRPNNQYRYLLLPRDKPSFIRFRWLQICV